LGIGDWGFVLFVVSRPAGRKDHGLRVLEDGETKREDGLWMMCSWALSSCAALNTRGTLRPKQHRHSPISGLKKTGTPNSQLQSPKSAARWTFGLLRIGDCGLALGCGDQEERTYPHPQHQRDISAGLRRIPGKAFGVWTRVRRREASWTGVPLHRFGLGSKPRTPNFELCVRFGVGR